MTATVILWCYGNLNIRIASTEKGAWPFQSQLESHCSHGNEVLTISIMHAVTKQVHCVRQVSVKSLHAITWCGSVGWHAYMHSVFYLQTELHLRTSWISRHVTSTFYWTMQADNYFTERRAVHQNSQCTARSIFNGYVRLAFWWNFKRHIRLCTQRSSVSNTDRM